MNLQSILIISLSLVFVVACSSHQSLTTAPLGDKNTLEKLAEAYRVESKRYPISPPSMRPKARKQFILDVFSRAGFSYSETLLSLSKTDKKAVNQLHKDMAQLLSLPHNNSGAEVKLEIYTETELKAIELIEML